VRVGCIDKSPLILLEAVVADSRTESYRAFSSVNCKAISQSHLYECVYVSNRFLSGHTSA
jgi:hypothetical protein